MKGKGPGIFEIVEDHRGDTYRAVYTVRFADVVYVLHAFQKKSKTGIKTPQDDVNLIAERLKRAQADYVKEQHTMSTITHGSTNVFADLGYEDSAERQTKTRLALAVNELLKSRKLKQREIATLLAIPQPKVSALKNYRLDQFSVERLMEFLTTLNQDVEIIIRPRTNSGGAGHISVLALQ